MRENIQSGYIRNADIIPNWDDMRTIVDITKLYERLCLKVIASVLSWLKEGGTTDLADIFKYLTHQYALHIN